MPPRSNNIRALDGIRGIAIILVMLHHFQDVLPPSGHVLQSIKSVFYFGWSGVDLFFALSGFLITGILLDTRTSANYFPAFYARRVLRIFPLYYSVLIVILGAAALIHPRPQIAPLVEDQKLYFCYLVNWLALWKGSWGPNILGHFWSLAVEEQFYLIWPLCVWLFPLPRLSRLAILGALVALCTRLYWIAHDGPSQALAWATVTRMDSLLCGALGAIFFRDEKVMSVVRRTLPVVSIVAISGFVAGAVWESVWEKGAPFDQSFGFSLLAIGFSALVLYVAATDNAPTLLQRALRNRVLTDFGKYSYGIYVYHVPLLLGCNHLLIKYGPKTTSLHVIVLYSVLYFVFLFVASFFVAKISYEYFERYFLGLKRYFVPRTRPTEPPPLAAKAQPA